MKKAFTLIELLIVVAIIAILAAIAVPNFLEAQTRAKVSRCKADMRTMATAFEAYTVDENKPPMTRSNYPGNLLNGPSLINNAFPNNVWVSYRFRKLTTPISYITSVVQDPFVQAGYTFNPDGTQQNSYDTYDYFDAFADHPGGYTSRANAANWRGAGLCSGGIWRLSGCGPDRFNGVGGNTVEAGLVPAQRGVDYDPTNGTVSAGDIVRVGGPGPLNPSSGGILLPAIDRVQNKYNMAIP